MAKGNTGGRKAATIKNQATNNQTAKVAPPQAAKVAKPTNEPVIVDNGPYRKMTDAEAAKIRAANDKKYRGDALNALKMYTSDSNPNGDQYSHAQNLNYKLDNGLPLNTNEKYIDDNIQKAMHNIGQNTVLKRYAHDDILKKMGIKDYTKMTEKQLQNVLLGTTVRTTSYLSTSYDEAKSPFAPGQIAGGGREVEMEIRAGANTKVAYGIKKQAEVIVNKNTDLNLVEIKYLNRRATPRNGRTKQVIKLVFETV